MDISHLRRLSTVENLCIETDIMEDIFSPNTVASCCFLGYALQDLIADNVIEFSYHSIGRSFQFDIFGLDLISNENKIYLFQ